MIHPITVMFDDKLSTIKSVPFPAVTLCPAARIAVNKLNLSSFQEKFKNSQTPWEDATNEELKKYGFNIRFNYLIDANFKF